MNFRHIDMVGGFLIEFLKDREKHVKVSSGVEVRVGKICF